MNDNTVVVVLQNCFDPLHVGHEQTPIM